ncbi:hypothetical protein BDBG_17705 [Blastomyces gilchristii SLH14081]|uniref:Uncharacterized protein n=1 Tax=Blastomyces gilchristii (strain SLH14081) TaxID=559298 RepID=A0A179UYF8_BLAGS|nr:uncharacterized protein BDBG_17705 [Blastomyces gilchristii SLH14081]OAT12853.1 hypothetical protein BDBG_17705 [Blastomyces gilchristii SLH14081]
MTLEEINHLFAQSGVSAQHVAQHIQKERRGGRLVRENGHEIRLVPPKKLLKTRRESSNIQLLSAV